MIVVIAAIAGMLGSFVASDRAESTGRIDDEAEVIKSTRSVQADLARADAAAASAFLAGGSRPELQNEQRLRYLDAMADVAADLEQAARLTGNDEVSHHNIEAMTRLVAEYSGLVETARTNNRQGFPIGAAYLNAASDLLSREGSIRASDEDGVSEAPGIFQLTDEVANAAARRYRDEYNNQQTVSLVLVGLALLVMLTLVAVLVSALLFMSRRFRRLINPAVGLATVLALALTVWMAIGFLGHSGELRSARQDGYGGIRAYVDVRALAFGAKGDEAKYLIARGDGAAFEARFQNRSVKDTLSTAAALADTRLEQDAGADARDRWAAYETLHTAAVAAEQGGARVDAVNIVLLGSIEGSSDEFEAFDVASADALSANLQQFNNRMRNARNSLAGLVFAPAIGALLIALLAWYGIQQRISEYR